MGQRGKIANTPFEKLSDGAQRRRTRQEAASKPDDAPPLPLEPPKDLTGDARLVWTANVRASRDAGRALTLLDEGALRQYCELLSRFKALSAVDPATDPTRDATLMKLSAALKPLGDALLLNPMSRTRAGIKPRQQDQAADPFEKFILRKKGTA